MRKENLISMVEERKAELIDLVSRLIRINSENPTGTQREVVDFVEKYLEKGTEVVIEGKLMNNSYTDKDGNKKYNTEIQVLEIMLLGGKASS